MTLDPTPTLDPKYDQLEEMKKAPTKNNAQLYLRVDALVALVSVMAGDVSGMTRLLRGHNGDMGLLGMVREQKSEEKRIAEVLENLKERISRTENMTENIESQGAHIASISTKLELFIEESRRERQSRKQDEQKEKEEQGDTGKKMVSWFVNKLLPPILSAAIVSIVGLLLLLYADAKNRGLLP